MHFQYFPTNKIIIDGVALEFLDQRNRVREKIGTDYKEDNQVIDLGDDVAPILQRRDIYEDINSSECFFFLIYDKDDLLREVEVHHCDDIQVFDALFSFNEGLDAIANKLMKYSDNNKESEGEYLFRDLKIVITSKEQMGGDGNSLGYFYCTIDITHLEDDNDL